MSTPVTTSADTRSVHTDALAVLGTIIDASVGRDAIHLAVAPTVAPVRLHAGQDVTKDGHPVPKGHAAAVGIVDPFLSVPVQPGERFLLVIYPRVITSLRHVWSHPSFVDEGAPGPAHVPPASASNPAERHLTEVADEIGITLWRLIEGADEYLKSGEYMHGGSDYEGVYVGDQFWDAYEAYTGRIVPSSDRGSFFSCSC